jgi:chromosome segregation ATPase
VSVRTSGGDGGALYWAERYKGERDEWKQTAEDIFRMACEIEQERDDSDCCVGLMVGLLLDAERECETTSEQADVYMAECERQAAEIVALRNEVDEKNAEWLAATFDAREAQARADQALEDRDNARLFAHRVKEWRTEALDARDDAQEAAADYHAAWQDAEERLEEAEKQLGYLTPDVRGAIAQGCSVWCRERDEARRLARKYRSAYLRTGCIDAAPVAPDHWLNEAD